MHHYFLSHASPSPGDRLFLPERITSSALSLENWRDPHPTCILTDSMLVISTEIKRSDQNHEPPIPDSIILIIILSDLADVCDPLALTPNVTV